MIVSLMVVDDEPDVAKLFQRRFRQELRDGKYVMHFARSGEEALQLLDTGVEPQVMLILSDINMPGMSGIDLVKETKSRWPSLPVAMITAYGDPENRRQAREAGAVHILTKPIDFHDLKLKIEEMVRDPGI